MLPRGATIDMKRIVKDLDPSDDKSQERDDGFFMEYIHTKKAYLMDGMHLFEYYLMENEGVDPRRMVGF